MLHKKQQELESVQQTLAEFHSYQQDSGKSISELKKWDKALRSNLKTKEQELEDANSLVSQLQQEADSLNSSVMEKQESIIKYKKRVADLKEMVMEATRAKDKAENAFSGAIKASKALEREVLELTTAKEELEGKLAQKIADMDYAIETLTKKYEEKLAKRNEELEISQDLVSSLKRECKSAASDLSIVQAERAAQQQANHALEESIRTAEGRFESVNRMCRSLQEDLDHKSNAVSELTKLTDTLQSELTAKNSDSARLQKELTALQESSTSMQKELLNLKTIYSNVTAELTSSQQHNAELEREVAGMYALTEELTATQDMVLSQKHMIDDLREEKSTLSQTCRDSAALVDVLSRELEEIRPQRVHLEQFQDDAKQKLHDQQCEMTALTQERAALQKELDICRQELLVIAPKASELADENRKLQEQVCRYAQY
jgi:chromosome segregation ATPase